MARNVWYARLQDILGQILHNIDYNHTAYRKYNKSLSLMLMRLGGLGRELAIQRNLRGAFNYYVINTLGGAGAFDEK